MSKKKYVIETAFENMGIQKIMQIGIDANCRIVHWTDSIENIEELNSDYINMHFSDLQDTAYQKGFEDGKKSKEKGCDGCRYESKWQKENPCKDCSNCYKSQYEPMPKDEICFGDEIVVNGERGVVASHENEGSATIWALLNGYRTPQIVHKNNYTKTGRRFDMAGIMEAVKNG